jgi:hypothetical protein
VDCVEPVSFELSAILIGNLCLCQFFTHGGTAREIEILVPNGGWSKSAVNVSMTHFYTMKLKIPRVHRRKSIEETLWVRR